jgi:hypothetical protein
MKIKLKQEGSALIYVLAVVAAASVLFAGTIQFVVSHVRFNASLEPNAQSIQLAESGIYFYRWYLAHNVEGKSVSQIESFWNSDPLGVDDNGDGDCDDPDTADGDGDGTEAYVADYKDETGAVIGQYKICVTPPEEYSTVIYVESRGYAESSGIKKEHAIRARLRKPSWSEFAVLGNNMIRLSEGTEIYGPIHINGGFHFDGTAHNVVTSAVDSYCDSDGDVKDDGGTPCGGWWSGGVMRPGVWAANVPGSDNSVDPDDTEHFLAGKQYPVVSQDFNSVTADFSLMQEAASDMSVTDDRGGGTIDLNYNSSGRGRLIEFGVPSPGKMRITRVRRFSSSNYNITRLYTGNSNVDEFDIPDVAIIYVADNVWVEGDIPADKRITIAAHNSSGFSTPRIFIGRDDIYYEDYDSDTVLGLAAEGDISLIRDSDGDLSAPDGSDEETLHIDAVLLSQKGRIGRDYFGDYKDTLELYGAIATNERMGFGYTDGTGFETRILIFDNNVLYGAPPLFPTGNSYAIDLWDEIE